MKIKKGIKAFLIILLILIVIIGAPALIFNGYVKAHGEKGEINGEYDCILVLGCGVKPDGKPSDMLLDRIETACELYKQGVAPIILMTGDHGRDDYDEVDTMLRYAVSLGVPKEAVFLDHAGFSTYESMFRAKEIFGVEKAVIVTQEYHLYRAVYDAKAFGIDAVGASADKHTYAGQTIRDVREIIARDKDFLYCIFKPKPKYLGEKISFSSDSSLTHG